MSKTQELYETKASLDAQGNFHAQSLEEPDEILLIDEQTKNVGSNASFGTWGVENPDLTRFLENDNTLGNAVVEGWMYVSSTTYTPRRMEYCRVNNDKGFVVGNFDPEGGWIQGWNRVSFPVGGYQDKDNTPWHDMTRLEFYRTGPTDGTQDTSQYVTIKNLKLKKFENNQAHKGKLGSSGTFGHKELIEVNKAYTDPIADYTVWEVGTTGGQGSPFNSINGSSADNAIVYFPDPWDNLVPTWECRSDGNDSGHGGWNMTFNGDDTQRLRMTVFVKRKVNWNGRTYHGCDNSNNTLGLGGSTDGNPYFWSGDMPNLDEWYLMVGIVHPNAYSGGDSGLSGVYDLSGSKVRDGTEYKWAAGSTQQELRDYFYYSTDPEARQYFVYPRVDVVDGSEPSLQELLWGLDAREYLIDSTASDKEEGFYVRGEFKEV